MRATSFCSGVGSSAVASSISAIAAHLGVHAGRRDHRATGALRDGRALEDHVEAVAERAPAARSVAASLSTASLSPVSEASCTRSDGGLNQARVGADGVAFAEHEHVAAHQLGARQRAAPGRRAATAEVTAVIRASAATAFSALASCTIAEDRVEHDDRAR